MHPLTAAELLAVWETASARSPVDRALALLAAACPEHAPDALAQLSIGRRDACLLTLREWAFGAQLVSVADCPQCGDMLELLFQVDDVRVPPVDLPEPLSLTADEYAITFRLPNSHDLAALRHAGNSAGARVLLQRCLVSAQRGDVAQVADELPEQVMQAMTDSMAQADPQADVELRLTCPNCAHAWLAPFDISSFFWQEIEAWAGRLLRDIHCLARAYGWREADVLALSPQRRQIYLEMIGT